MGKAPKILTNDKYKYYELEFPIYKTKGGCSLIKIGNVFYNMECHKTIDKYRFKPDVITLEDRVLMEEYPTK